MHAQLEITAERDDGFVRLTMAVRNTAAPVDDKDDAIAVSLIGTHLVAAITDGDFVSLLEPPASADSAVARCRHHRCFPVLAGPAGDHALMLVSPIILYDHPEIAEQSEGALFDSTEIDEILTLRIMTMTDRRRRMRARPIRSPRRSSTGATPCPPRPCSTCTASCETRTAPTTPPA